ncbi:MAG: hypothetical protein JWL81_113, partial [Verrucomicrobiales bacterium]|nr:hypothetical protein [Verrucomicrobiales bacterium]
FPSVMDGKAAGGARFGGSMKALMAAADVVVMPSLQEGFGLPYLEAAALGKPLLARAVPGVAENLSGIGCSLVGTYAGLPVPADRYDAGAERKRCGMAWTRVAAALPESLRGLAGEGAGFAGEGSAGHGRGVDFAALTLAGQLEVLSGNRFADGAACPEPNVADWEEAAKVDRWADRFFEAGGGGDEAGESGAEAGAGILEEVRRRFAYWREHPLLWP